MKAKSYTQFLQNPDKEIQSVCDDHDILIITRDNGQPAVIMSLEDWEAWKETHYLLSTPNNAKRLMESINDVSQGTMITVDIDLDQ